MAGPDKALLRNDVNRCDFLGEPGTVEIEASKLKWRGY